MRETDDYGVPRSNLQLWATYDFGGLQIAQEPGRSFQDPQFHRSVNIVTEAIFTDKYMATSEWKVHIGFEMMTYGWMPIPTAHQERTVEVEHPSILPNVRIEIRVCNPAGWCERQYIGSKHKQTEANPPERWMASSLRLRIATLRRRVGMRTLVWA